MQNAQLELLEKEKITHREEIGNILKNMLLDEVYTYTGNLTYVQLKVCFYYWTGILVKRGYSMKDTGTGYKFWRWK